MTRPPPADTVNKSQDRPFRRALRDLERLTAGIGNPVGYGAFCTTAVSSTCQGGSLTTPRNAGGNAKRGRESTTLSDSGGRRSVGFNGSGHSADVDADHGAVGARGDVGRACDGGGGDGGGSGDGSGSAALWRCRVGFDLIDLLTGADGCDAMGKPVGVSPGQDLGAALLDGCAKVRLAWTPSTSGLAMRAFTNVRDGCVVVVVWQLAFKSVVLNCIRRYHY